MKNKMYQKENNLFQSLNWLAFQENYGHKVIYFGDTAGMVFDLPFGKKFVWIQKGPTRLTGSQLVSAELPKGTVFVRIEPEKVTAAEVAKYSLKKVTQKSLLAGQRSPLATRILDISGSEEEILAYMKPKTRYNIRLAAKKGVTVKVLDNEDILFDLLTKTASRDKGYSPHQKEYYTKMIKDLAKNDVAHIFVAEHEGDFLAAIVVSFFGEVATYLHGGFNDQKRNLMAPYLCQWEAMRYARSRGCKYYDFWGVAATDDPADPWAGISRFKEGFGGERIITSGSYDLVLNKLWYNLLTLLARVRHLLR